MSEISIKAEPTIRIQWDGNPPKYLGEQEARKELEGYPEVGKAKTGRLFGEAVTVRRWAKSMGAFIAFATTYEDLD